TASSVPLNGIPPEGYLGPDCEGPVYSPSVPEDSVLWPGPHFDWLSTLHPTATPYVPQVGDRLVYIVRGHKDYLAQSWQNNELPTLSPPTEHGDSLPTTTVNLKNALPWVSCPGIPPYTCGSVTEIHYSTVRTITDHSTNRMPTTPYRGVRAGAAWRRRGSRSGVKHAGTSSKRLPTGSEPTCQSGPSAQTVPPVAYSGDSFVRLVTLRLRVDPDDQPYAHLANPSNFAGTRSSWKSNNTDSGGDLFTCPVGDVWWTGCVLHSPPNFLSDPHAICQPSTSSAPALPHCVKDPWLSCLIRWMDEDQSTVDSMLDGPNFLPVSDLTDLLDRDTDSRDNLPENVDRLSPWDMHPPYPKSSDEQAEDRPHSVYPSQTQMRQIYGVPFGEPYESLSVHKREYKGKCRQLNSWSTQTQTLLECFQEIMKLPVSELFSHPVDLVSYPDYLFVNPYPVDLTLIVARLSTGFYRQPEAVRSDLQHLLDNAVRYNRPDSAVVQHARLVFQLAIRALDDIRFKPCHISKEYDRLLSSEPQSTQIPSGSSARRSHSRSKSPGQETERSQITPQRRVETNANDDHLSSPCETRVYSTSTRRVRRSQRKRPSRSRTDSSSETKTCSLPDGDEESEDPLEPDGTEPCACSFLPSQWVPRCMTLMKRLCSQDRSMFFREPIDTKLYPDYRDIVSVPMDLSTIQKRLRTSLDTAHPRNRELRSRSGSGVSRRRRSFYACPHAFIRDLYRIVRNSKLYNDDPETVVYGDTRWLEDWIERMIVSSLRRHGLLLSVARDSEPNEPDRPQVPQWHKSRERSSYFRTRSRLTNRSRVRGPPLYKRPRTVTRGHPTRDIYYQTSVEVSTHSELLHRTSSGRVVKPPLRNIDTIPYTFSLSSDDSPSDVPDQAGGTVKRGRRAQRPSSSPRRACLHRRIMIQSLLIGLLIGVPSIWANITQPSALAILAPGFEEIGLTTVVSVLRREQVRVDLVSWEAHEGAVHGEQHIGVDIDSRLPPKNSTNYGVVILPGGQMAADKMSKNRALGDMLTKYALTSTYVAAIGEAPLVLQAFKLFTGYNITANVTLKSQLSTNYTVLSKATLVKCQNLITVSGSASSFSLAAKILKYLFPNQNKDIEIAAQLSFPIDFSTEVVYP
ncbi:unnamed protein product, partial [Echinostoma caproni]|uniref:Bromo domain-containing protein n=1 Tax=Echinostoma caproni TaxID=27848 RepID=A0A183A8L5_9TREM